MTSGTAERWRAAAVLVAIQAMAVGAWLWGERRREEPTLPFLVERLDPGAPLAPLEFRRADGSSLRLRDGKRPVLLHHWATWCAPCRKELPALLEFAKEVDGIDVIAVTDEEWPEIAAWFPAGVPGPVVQDPTGQAKRAFDVSALPDTWLLDGEGRPRLRMGGPRDWRDPAARVVLEGELGTAR